MIPTRVFRALSALIAGWPRALAACSLALALFLTAGMPRLQLKDYIRDGYTPDNAPSRAETAAMRRFWNASGDPMKTLVLVRSRLPDRNMLRADLLGHALRLQRFLQRDFVVQYGKMEQFSYADVCQPYCDYNFPLELFVDGLESAMASSSADEQNSGDDSGRNLSFPLAMVHSFQVRLDRYFYDMTLHSSSGNNQSNADPQHNQQQRTPEQHLTNMDRVGMVVFTFLAERSSIERGRLLSAWETALYEFMRVRHADDQLDVQVIGVEIVDHEMTRDASENMHCFAAGVLAMALFVALNVFGSARLLLRADDGAGARRMLRLHAAGHALLCAAAIGCPLLAIGATYGAMAWAGWRINSFLLILPYLILGIGVDDGFLLMHRWFQLGPHIRAPADRTRMVLADVGPSITVTTLTNVISFGIGAFTPTPEIRLFCFGTALALTLDYVLQLALFCPLMQCSARFECVEHDAEYDPEEKKSVAKMERGQRSRENGDSLGTMLAEPKRGTRKWAPEVGAREADKEGVGERIRHALDAMLDAYCTLLTNRWFGALLLLALAFYWYGALLGAHSIRSRLDVQKILPAESKLRETYGLLDRHIWANHLPVTVIIDGPLNVSTPGQLALLDELAAAFESLPRSKGPHASQVWLRDYARFWAGADGSARRMRQFMGELGMPEEESEHDGEQFNEAELDQHSQQDPQGDADVRMDLCRLDQFLDMPFYAHWAAYMRLQRDLSQNASAVTTAACPRVQTFIMHFAYQDAAGWDARIALQQQWRAVAARFAPRLHADHGLNVSVWEENAQFVDQMLGLRAVAGQSWFLTMGCMLLVCALFVPSPASVLLAGVSISSISLGVFGFLAWLGFDLDPVTMAATLMSIGLSVDFTAHVVYHFRLEHRIEFGTDPHTGVQQIRQVPLHTHREKLRHTLRAVGWPMLQSGLSTTLCIAPLLFVHKYAPRVFVNAVFLVCAWGLLHGLLVLPSVLCMLPLHPFRALGRVLFRVGRHRKSEFRIDTLQKRWMTPAEVDDAIARANAASATLTRTTSRAMDEFDNGETLTLTRNPARASATLTRTPTRATVTSLGTPTNGTATLTRTSTRAASAATDETPTNAPRASTRSVTFRKEDEVDIIPPQKDEWEI